MSQFDVTYLNYHRGPFKTYFREINNSVIQSSMYVTHYHLLKSPIIKFFCGLNISFHIAKLLVIADV